MVKTWLGRPCSGRVGNLLGVEPYRYLADVITRIVDGHPQSRLDQLLPWAYRAPRPSSRLWPENDAYSRCLPVMDPSRGKR